MAGINYLYEDEWGKDISFNLVAGQCPDDDLIQFVSWNSLLSPEKSYKNSQDLVSTLKSYINQNCNQNLVRNIYNIEDLNHWLNDFIEKTNSNDLHIEELVEIIMLILRSENKSPQEMENDLSDLLSSQTVSTIRQLVKNRKSIIKSYQSIYKDETLPSASNLPSDYSYYGFKKPSITQSLIVQTEDEKNFKKMIRKYEKKVAKELAREGGTSENVLTYERLKKDKEKELALSMCTPLFKQRETFERVHYPFVFDSYFEAKNTAAFISGRKLSLPFGFERSDKKKWEEISIPAHSESDFKIFSNFDIIEVKNLDELAKIIFAGFKKLNLVQSIVYQTACFTNNNMLICAPTGAGKTNVAMLGILNELRKYYDLESKQFKTQDFKIVYIAPMKALAAEMVSNFSKRLESLGIKVKELTGDIQLTKAQIIETHIIVTTPEKWDIVTRKPKSDIVLLELLKLLIIDEVHLLQSDRGPVLEALVARTIRHVESTQKMIRIIGLSATLPNYIDVATFLRVNLKEGLFFFDDRFRPVPLYQNFIGIRAVQPSQQMSDMDEVCYEKVQAFVSKNQQCMIFVHARSSTFRIASNLRQIAQQKGHIDLFKPSDTSGKILEKLQNRELRELLPYGFGIHHAGMIRFDRSFVEKLFKEGKIKVLACTATLAWGINLPAHAVIIRGTEIYDPAHGGYVDLSMLDVMQIFGRAGRPQFDKKGHGTIITTSDKLVFYLSLLTNQSPIESQFDKCLVDNLNAEIVLGTVSTIEEAIEWLGYTYLFIRMLKNPQAYGLNYSVLKNDPKFLNARRKLIIKAAISLDNAQMIRYDEVTGCLDPTDLGRTASHYYIKYKTVEIFNQMLNESMLENEILHMICCAEEFDQLKSREEEMEELSFLRYTFCKLKIPMSEDKSGKVNVLIQAYLSRARIEVPSLISDTLYIIQNVIRMARGLFEYTLTKGFASLANKFLLLSKMLECQMWNDETPFRQFSNQLTCSDFEKIQKLGLTVAKVKSPEMTSKMLSSFMRIESKGALLKQLANTLPSFEIITKIQPITRTVLRIILEIVPSFIWNDSYNGKKSEAFWIWLQDADSEHIYYHQFLKVTKQQVIKKETQTLTFTIPLLDPNYIPSHYIIHYDSDHWLGCNQEEAISCKDLILPENFLPFTKLLDLNPLPISALNNPFYESIYSFTHFNPIQTQIFHTLYHTDHNVMLGAPTGSGKTNCAEIAMFRVFNHYPKGKIVYIAPLKALVRERVKDWKFRLEPVLKKKVIELTGDTLPDARAIISSDIIVTTPEKWDGVSRSWKSRKYVRDVCLIIIDEVHLLGEDRGPVLEVIISRTNFINNTFEQKIRLVGLSTAVANAQDLANWLNIGKVGLYNFKPSVRPVPLEVHIAGFPGRHYCPRMASMNKPTYKAIKQHSNQKPVIIFVSSRRQTRLTALDLIAFVAQDNTKQWLNLKQEEIEFLIQNNINDSNLKLTLAFGIGLHHAGLQEKDRSLVEELFLNQKIQILVTTATLAWGVNLPAHLVIIKGTEYYNGKTHRYIDFPITDVLQMMGRAGRPQFDEKGKVVIFVHDIKKEFYKKFLYEPFPVESHLIPVIEDHLNAEIVAGTIQTKSECVDYLTWTYLFRRMFKNPAYYGLKNTELETVNKFLTNLIYNALTALINSNCIETDIENEQMLIPTTIGRIASYYYLHHTTVKMFVENLIKDNLINHLLHLLCNAYEYNELPVRHNEDLLNAELAKDCRFPVFEGSTYNSSHTKAYLLLQAHFSRLELPCSDYLTDLKSVLDQTIRILQAMVDIAAMSGYLITVIRLIQILQMISQGIWFDDISVSYLPHVDSNIIQVFSKRLSIDLPQLIYMTQKNSYHFFSKHLHAFLEENQIIELFDTVSSLPLIDISFTISKLNETESNLDEQKPLQKKDVFEIDQIDFPINPINQRKFYQLVSNCEYVLTLRVIRNNQKNTKSGPNLSKAYAPKFPKLKDENWFVIIGDCDSQELIALKRINQISSENTQNINLLFKTPQKLGRIIYTVFFLSDCYLGLDQQYDLGFEIMLEVVQ